MKTALLSRAIIALFVIPAFIFGSNENKWKGKHTKEKVIKKEYTVNENATVKVDNSYGNIDVVTWNENRVEIEITITTSSNDEDKAQERLDAIKVEFEASPNMVSAKTKFSHNKTKSWWKWGKKNKVNMKVNYIIKMPISNNVDFKNDYGSINLDKLEGRANIDCDYGKVTTKELMADNNSISFDYTNNSYFEYIKSGKINADYSSYIVGKTKRLDINSDYTKSTIEIAEDITYNGDYGAITVEKVNNIKGNGDYLTTHIGEVYKNVDIKANNGSLKIKNITDNAGDVNIESSYVGIKIGYHPYYNFSFDIDLNYGSLDYKDLEITKENKSSSKKYYSGYHGNSNSGNTVKIKSNYGGVTLSKN